MTHTNRPTQIYALYRQLIQAHLADLVNGKADTMLDIENFASQICIHPTHLSNTIKEVTGLSACGVFQLEIGQVAKQLLSDPTRTVQDVALTLDFEPSQFTKWFKRICGTTPRAFKLQQRQILKS